MKKAFIKFKNIELRIVSLGSTGLIEITDGFKTFRTSRYKSFKINKSGNTIVLRQNNCGWILKGNAISVSKGHLNLCICLTDSQRTTILDVFEEFIND